MCFQSMFMLLCSMKRNQLEKRLIEFSINVIKFVEKLERGKANSYLANQIIRSSTSAALNYGEAQSAESPKDFIHKMQVGLKELRETFVGLRILVGLRNIKNEESNLILDENNQLISIFVTSIRTAKSRSRFK